MNRNLLDLPFLNAHPKLQGVISHFYQALISSINGVALGILSIILTFALYYQNSKIAIIASLVYFLFFLFFTIYVLYLVFISESPYNINKYNLSWHIEDEAGNIGKFVLDQEIVLNRMTDAISLYFPLDDYVKEIKPFSIFALYYGYRKRIAAHLNSFKRAGTKISLTAHGHRNINRKDGNNLLEIPIDFPTNELNVVIAFDKIANVDAEIFVRNGSVATQLDLSDDCNLYVEKGNGNGCTIYCKLKKPKFGHSYIITWRLKS